MVDKDFFIILDRLYSTLDKEMLKWSDIYKRNKGILFGLCGRNNKNLKQLMITRMTVAYDLAAAFFYLHENRLVYRDIKVRIYNSFIFFFFVFAFELKNK